MRLQQLLIERPHSYSSDITPLKGTVTIKGSNGEQTINLSAGIMNQLFRIIALECGITAKQNADRVQSTIMAASDEVIMIENDGNLLIEA